MRRHPACSALLLAAIVPALTLVSGCSSLGYYAQAARGQMALLRAARPIDDWLADPAAPSSLKDRLRQAREMREFASRELGLPDNRSYTRYADLKRTAAVWNVFATPELSLRLKTWCYPLFGCAGYRGYFDRADAERLGADLAREGYDVAVVPVPAYSTMGWFDDPLLNTFIGLPPPELARLIFHELAHQVVYVHDDTTFNESFATAVERVGVRRWLAQRADPAMTAEYERLEARRREFLALLLSARQELEAAYASAVPDADKRARKREILEALEQRYRRVRDQRWDGWTGYDGYFAKGLNNAHLASIGAYYDRVPAFEALIRDSGGLGRPFFEAVKRLAALPPPQRAARLDALAPVTAALGDAGKGGAYDFSQ
jgi:predicted aminopeptidase